MLFFLVPSAIPFTVDIPYFMPMPDVDLLNTGRSLNNERLHVFGLVEDLLEKYGNVSITNFTLFP